MKTKEIAGILLIIMCSLSVYAKEKSKDSDESVQAPKDASNIVVQNNLSDDESFELIISNLAKNNYVLQTKDKNNFTIKISKKDVYRQKIFTYLFTLSIKDNSVSVIGKYNTSILIGPTYDAETEKKISKISNKGWKGSISKETFAKMQSLALSLGSDPEYNT